MSTRFEKNKKSTFKTRKYNAIEEGIRTKKDIPIIINGLKKNGYKEDVDFDSVNLCVSYPTFYCFGCESMIPTTTKENADNALQSHYKGQRHQRFLLCMENNETYSKYKYGSTKKDDCSLFLKNNYKDYIKPSKTDCECGGTYNCSSKQRHLRSKLHVEFVNGIDPVCDIENVKTCFKSSYVYLKTKDTSGKWSLIKVNYGTGRTKEQAIAMVKQKGFDFLKQFE